VVHFLAGVGLLDDSIAVASGTRYSHLFASEWSLGYGQANVEVTRAIPRLTSNLMQSFACSAHRSSRGRAIELWNQA